MKVTLLGKDFKAVVAAVTKLPPLGSFADSEKINFSLEAGFLTVSTFGVVLAVDRIPAEGELPLVATERRTMEAFAPYCRDTAKVTLQVVGTELVVKCRGHEAASATTPGQVYVLPSIKEVEKIKISATNAKRIGFLADVAFSDSSRADLNCVMVTQEGEAVACNQKTVAVLKLEDCTPSGNIAVPLQLAKILSAGDILYPGVKETVLKSGTTKYCMPAAVKAQKEFPLAAVRQYAKINSEELGTVSGVKLGEIVAECSAVLGQAARTEVILELVLAGGKMQVGAVNGGARFKAMLQATGTAECSLKVPLDGLSQVVPFVGDKATFKRGGHGELFLGVEDGWVLFPSWHESKKAK